MNKWIKRVLIGSFCMLTIIGFYLALSEKPIVVDTANVTLAPMVVSINEEGIAQIRDVYTVSSPITGHLDRLKLEQGDTVVANKSIIASIHPLDPPFLDDRTRTELAAAAEAANSAIMVAKVEFQRAETTLKQTISNFQRLQRLATDDLVSTSELENSESNVKLAKVQVESTLANIKLREAEFNSARARLQQTDIFANSSLPENCCIDLTAPIDGIVLEVIVQNETAIVAGGAIAKIGNPKNLEIVVDLLSTDAVKVKPGALVDISDWGGPDPLKAVVRRIASSAYTKTSALGIEEQRVNTYLDLNEVPNGLGHGYRVFAQIKIWAAESRLQIPIAAMFRSNSQWAVFVSSNGYAKLREIEVGKLNASHAEVISGLSEKDIIILYPSDVLEDGSMVKDRADGES